MRDRLHRSEAVLVNALAAEIVLQEFCTVLKHVEFEAQDRVHWDLRAARDAVSDTTDVFADEWSGLTAVSLARDHPHRFFSAAAG